MLTTRFWSSTVVVLHALLLQDCQSNPLRVIEEEGPAVSPSSTSAMHQCASSAPLAMLYLTPPSYSPAAHIFPYHYLTALANKAELSPALPAHSPSPTARHTLAIISNSLTAPYNLPAAVIPRVAHTHTVPGNSPRMYMSKVERALREMPSNDEEDSKLPARQQSTDLNDGDKLDKDDGEVSDEERWKHKCIRRDVLGIVLAMAGSEPDKAIAFLEILLATFQDKHCRQQALEAFGKVAKASPNMVFKCLPSLHAAAKEGDKIVRLLALKILGEVEWKHYFGEVGPVPDLPKDIATILDNACPIWPGKKIRDTHLLVLIPTTVGGRPFTLNLLAELIQHPKNSGNKAQCRYYSNAVKAQFGKKSPDRSYWLLMTRDVLEGSRGRAYSAQSALVARYTEGDGRPYEIPSVLEAAIAIFMHHARTGERLFGDRPRIYTRCQELVDDKYPVIIGGFESSGLYIFYDSYGYNNGCVAGCQKF